MAKINKKHRLSSLYFDSYGEFNPIQYLVDAFQVETVNAIKIEVSCLLKTEKVLEAINKDDEDGFWKFKPLITVEYTYYKSTKHDYLINEDGSCIIDMSMLKPHDGDKEEHQANISIFYVFPFNFSNALKLLLLKFQKKATKKSGREIEFLVQESDGRLNLVSRELKQVDVDVENDYNITMPIKKVKEIVDNSKPGLILFTGIPGTGKSFLIKYLAQNTDKRFIFVPVNLIPQLSAPSFLKFALTRFHNTVLIVEDAETVLVDRQISNSSAVSTLLNLTDGILGDIVELKILATINKEEQVDHALMRKGRLLAKVEFKALQPERACKLLKKLKKEITIDKDTTLAELYAIGDDNGHDGNVVKRKIGF